VEANISSVIVFKLFHINHGGKNKSVYRVLNGLVLTAETKWSDMEYEYGLDRELGRILSVNCWTVWHHSTEDSILYSHHYERMLNPVMLFVCVS
jgi:hypothetical protein